MEEWKEYKLGEVCEYNTKRISLNLLNRDNYISTENMVPNIGGVTLSSNLPETGNAIHYTEGNILISNIRPYFKKIWYANKKGGCSADVLCIKANEDIKDRYLYYLLSQQEFFDYVMAGAKGCKMPRGDKQHIMNWKISLPSLLTQQKIASILSSLDDKIEVNRRINEQLEELAQALFKSWFVDFKPFKDGEFVESELGMIPKGWKVGKLGDYCKVKSGYAFKSSWWQDKGLKVIKIKNITSNGELDMNECSYVAPENTLKAKDFKTEVGDLLIAMTGATIGKFCMICSNETMYVNQRVGKFFLGSNPIIRLPFIYCTLKTERVYSEIVNKGQGSAQPNISGSDIENIRIPIPTNTDYLLLFNEKLKSVFERMINNQQEITLLTTLRDTLLPKLMSGDIAIE